MADADRERARRADVAMYAAKEAGSGFEVYSPSFDRHSPHRLTLASQVRKAIEDVLLGGYRMPRSWAEASERHQLLYTDRPGRLQY